ncbi:hypothetical protein [Helicobacter suis]|uniref:hypothetical protein n=1 Tax=Helicobacter suis TaxID=104628 RepID=UPI002208F8DA|nr:hypothetical protein [Helicobacter suis]BDR27362.1 hypothetical protein HSHS1_01230 [Helicobacter suis HS1]
MLDLIYDKLQSNQLQDIANLIDRLKNVTFSVINMEDFKLGEERSNKMNARGNFSEKQQKIKELDDQKRLIPIYTREVFRKVFSENENKNSPIFTKEDQEEYLKAIKKYFFALELTSQKG